jgi:hypothetical protein
VAEHVTPFGLTAVRGPTGGRVQRCRSAEDRALPLSLGILNGKGLDRDHDGIACEKH